MTYIVVGALTAMMIVPWFGWFIVEIIIHSLQQDYNRGHWLQLLTEQSMWVYQYNGIIMAGCLAALHLATSVKTRASRVSSFVVQLFGFLAWFYEFYFVIPTFYDKNNTANLFCSFTSFETNGVATGAVGNSNGFSGEYSICNCARAVAAFAVFMQFVQGMLVLYSFAQIFIAPRLEDGTRKEIIEEDDAEVATVVQANPAGYSAINARVGMFSYLNLACVLLSLTGYAIFMYSLIDVVYHTGFLNGIGVSSYMNAWWNQLGDFALSANFRQLSLTLVFALAASSYAAFRHNRGIQAGALLLTVITTLQWWSLIIFGGRYLRQWSALPNPNIDVNNPNQSFEQTGYPRLNAQRAMYAGACVILAGETLRCFFLLGRYFSYVPVTRNNVIPTYIRGAFATANKIPVVLFWLEALTIFAWWVLQFVHESESGLFNYVSGYNTAASGGTTNTLPGTPFTIPMAYVVTETLFIWQTMYFLAVFIPELFSERTKTLASKQAALAVNVVIMCAYFLLSWPWSYAGGHTGGYWRDGSTTTLYNGVSPATLDICNDLRDNTGGYNCKLLQGASILSFISGLGFLVLAFYQLGAILAKLPHPGQVATIDGTVVDALPPTVGVQKSLGWMVWLMLMGLIIWSLSFLDIGTDQYGWESYSFGQLPSTPGQTDQQFRLLPAYLYNCAFPDIILLAFLAWSACELASNPVVANWHAWRTLVTAISALLFSFLVPQFIMVCRYLNWNSPMPNLYRNEKAAAAGFLIMCIGEGFLYLNALIVQKSPLIALPAAINNTTMPVQKQTELQNVVVTQPGVHQQGVPVGNTAGNVGSYGQPNQYGHTETTVTTADPVPTREYSGNQLPPA